MTDIRPISNKTSVKVSHSIIIGNEDKNNKHLN